MSLNFWKSFWWFIKSISGKKVILEKKTNPFWEDFDIGLIKNWKQNNKYNIVYENTKISSTMLAISLSVWIIVWWVGSSIIWQISPDSYVQEISSLVAKIITENKTWYETIKENEKNLLVIDKQWEIIDVYKKLQSYQEKILKEREEQVKTYSWILAPISEEIITIKNGVNLLNLWDINKWKNELKNKIVTKTSVDNSQIYKTVSEFIKEIKSELPDGFELKIQEQVWWRILVWSEFDGKKSIWYYADSTKFKDRLSKDAIKNWANNRYNNFLTIKQIENIALQKQISLYKNDKKTPIYIEIKELYSWNIKVLLHDNAMQKSWNFLVNPKKDTSDIIVPKIDEIVNGFLS